MTRARSHLALAVAIPLAVAFLAATQAQDAESDRRAPSGSRRGTFLGLLSVQKVQQDLKLSDAQIAEVKQLAQTSRVNAKTKYAALQKIEDRRERRDEIDRFTKQRDRQARAQVREILSGEQMTRLNQIRLQVRGAVYGVNNPRLAERLQLTPEQQEAAVELAQQTQKKVSEAYRVLRDVMHSGQREKFDDALQRVRKIRTDANQRAFALLTAEQREMFGELVGEKLEL